MVDPGGLVQAYENKDNGERRRRLGPKNKRAPLKQNTAEVGDLQRWSYLHMRV